MTTPCPDLGFVVRVQLAPGADARALSRELGAVVESRGLTYRVVGDARLDWVASEWVVSGDAGQATEPDRRAVIDWLTARVGTDVARHEVGPLIDLEGAV